MPGEFPFDFIDALDRLHSQFGRRSGNGGFAGTLHLRHSPIERDDEIVELIELTGQRRKPFRLAEVAHRGSLSGTHELFCVHHYPSL